MQQRRSGGLGPGALVAASLLWGTTGTAASFMPSGVPALAIGSVTMCIGGLLLFGVSARRAVRAIRDRRTLRWLAIGALGVFAYPLAFYSGMQLAGVAIGNAVALGSGPIFAAMFEWLFERRRPGLSWLSCTVLAVVGIVILALIGHGTSSARLPHLSLGVLLGLIAGIAYALYTYASTRALAVRGLPADDEGYGSRAVMGGMFGLGAILLLPVLLVTGAPLLHSGLSMGIAAYLALAPMFLAYLLFGFGLRTVRSTAATTITLIEPVVATVLAVTVVGERLSPAGWVGLGLILVGAVAMATARLPAKLS